ncbi:uncharacterized protein TM35_000321660 [Trypanosoma theileri]|uniref:Uncharacterized protein n=1 Tax=Trypanosoma theileri TaxID=67003 RepID=A0A1X0NMN3_9TRYP|nr:uncharacterized protein TM35_000321660 [Trypanosoma theileri]ORC85851.1 hypothetical protein TM35_000321660 [Trypanosoma theileri]
MKRIDDTGDRKGDVVVSSEGPEISASYRSPFGGRSYYPTTLFKRRSSSVPRVGGGFLKKSCSPRDAVEPCSRDGRSSSEGRSGVRSHREPISKDAPLLGRYRQGETERDRVCGVRNAGGIASDGRCISGSVTVVSPDQLGKGSRVVPVLRTGVGCVSGEGGVPMRDDFAEQTAPWKQATQLKRRVAVSCPPALGRSELPGEHKRRDVKKTKTSPDTTASPICPDRCCIHGRQAILDYVDMQRELRECYDALQERNAELEVLQTQFNLIQKERTVLESRFQIELQEVKEHCAESVARTSEAHVEWHQRVLSDQVASSQRDRESVEKLRTELRREREAHAHTQSELDAAQKMCLVLKQQLERLQDAPRSPVSLAGKGDLPAGGHGDQFSPDRHSLISMPRTPTPRRNPPPAPHPTESEECRLRNEILSLSPARGKPTSPVHRTCPERVGDEAFVGSAPANSTINISDPSIASSAVPDFDGSGPCLLLSETRRGCVMERAVVGEEEDCDGGTQRETEECTEGDGQPPSCDTRSNARTSQGERTALVTGISFSSSAHPLSGAMPGAALAVLPPAVHPFEHLAGQEALLCKELLRALLDKEKQLAELSLERPTLREKGNFAYSRNDTC